MILGVSVRTGKDSDGILTVDATAVNTYGACMRQVSDRSPPWRVLVFPGGTEAGLEINRALRDCKEVELHSAGAATPSAAEFRFKRHHSLPSIHAPNWLQELNSLSERLGIDYIYPAHDDVILALAANAQHVSAAVLGSPLETCVTTRSKSATYKALDGIVATPATYEPDSVPSFPVFVKPDRGQGSQGARKVHDAAELARIVATEPGLLISEYLPGEEFTIDCFTDRNRRLLFARGRSRLRVRNGISMQSRLVEDPRFVEIAHDINRALPLRGAWFFQLKYDAQNTLRLLEVAPRIAGTMALNRICGANFPLLTLYDASGYDVEITALSGDFEISRSLDNHYRLDFDYDAVYVDLDDTLIVRDAVNTTLVKFLYQCLNRKKQIHLVTRHRHDVHETLRRFRLDGLFDSVVRLDQLEKKSAYLAHRDAIFIDDSFAERREVAAKLGLRTFDLGALEGLLDDRA